MQIYGSQFFRFGTCKLSLKKEQKRAKLRKAMTTNNKNSFISLDDLNSSQSSEFWQLKAAEVGEGENAKNNQSKSSSSQLNLSIITGSNYDMDKPLEENRKSYSRMRALLIFWFISAVIILVYFIYFVYLVINKVK